MKPTILILSFIFCAQIHAQVGIGTNTPNTSSILELNSTAKGLLPPRMTMSQRNLIPSPVAGLLVWCSNCTVDGQLQIYNGHLWTNMMGGIAAGAPAIGDIGGGGVVAYIFQPGDPGYISGESHGLIAAVIDQSHGVGWGCYGTNIPGAEGLILGTGNQNTIDILNGCNEMGFAADLCDDLVSGGYSDWLLPSKDELNKVYQSKNIIGGFENWVYWSSSEIDANYAWIQNFTSGSQYSVLDKNYSGDVRAIRYF
jgi:hypothetical protein